MVKMTRQAYAEMYGPTVGDRVRLGDMELIIEVEEDRTSYGDEVKFGGGKVIRDGMGQSQSGSEEVVDVVITNALILDHWGIIKADIGIKDGRISGIGNSLFYTGIIDHADDGAIIQAPAITYILESQQPVSPLRQEK